ncbi:MAG TPA: ABC transporter ATP-binding protein [Polyangiales bacterium]|nr:ABC transporter ATP-binding protein [Polyangiales bacterium]
MAILELKGVSKGYGSGSDRTQVLSGLELSIDKGEFVALVGYSGAGKTTLVSLIAGLLAPDTGSLHFAGKPVTGPGPDRGVVFQNYSLLPWLTVSENIALAVDAIFVNESAEQRRERVARNVALVNLTPAKDKKPGQLSGGMRQRVALARALAMEPELLLLDEPLSALDALTRATLQDELARICRVSGKTIFLITNDVDEGILLADRIIPLSAGPAATLGPSIAVEIERPRNRKSLNHDERFKAIRSEVIEYLLDSAAKKRGRGAAPSPQATALTPRVELAR